MKNKKGKKCDNCMYGCGTKLVCNNESSDEYTNYVDQKMTCRGWCGKSETQK